MESILEPMNHYSNLITATATAILAILTLLLWFENRYLRKAGSAPQIAAYLLPHPDGHGGIEFILANVGRGPAFDVTYTFICDEADFQAHQVALSNDSERKPISALPQGDTFKALFGIGFELYGKIDKKDIGPLKPFDVSIQYTDIFNREKKEVRTIDIRQFAGVSGIVAKSNERTITEAISKIEQHLSTIARQSARFTGFVDVTQVFDQFAQKAKGNPE